MAPIASTALVVNTALARIRQLLAHLNIRLDPRRRGQHTTPAHNQDTVETTALIKVGNPAAGIRQANRRAGQIGEMTSGPPAHATNLRNTVGESNTLCEGVTSL